MMSPDVPWQTQPNMTCPSFSLQNGAPYVAAEFHVQQGADDDVSHYMGH